MRIFLFLCLVVSSSLAQPNDAKSVLIYPVNPPRLVPGQESSATEATPTKRDMVSPPVEFSVEAGVTRDEPNGAKAIELKIVSLSEIPPSTQQISLSIQVYEKTAEGDVTIASSVSSAKWLMLPTDWKDAKTEELLLTYPGPKPGLGSKFYGYIVSVYYKGNLQDSTSSPSEMLSRFPPKETISDPEPPAN